jgi:hypothetical protein
MRKIIRYSSLSWDPQEWDKKLTWGDLDLSVYRGSKINEKLDEYPNAIEDHHVMFALVSNVTTSKMTIIPIDHEMEPQTLTMNRGGIVLVGNGFVEYETRLGDLKD